MYDRFIILRDTESEVLQTQAEILFNKDHSTKESFELLYYAPVGYTFYIGDYETPLVKAANKHFICVNYDPIHGEFDREHREMCSFGLLGMGACASIHKQLDVRAKNISWYLHERKRLNVSDHCDFIPGTVIADALAASGLLNKIYVPWQPIGLNDTLGGTHYLAILKADDEFINEFECFQGPLSCEGETYRIVKIPVSSDYVANWYPVITIDNIGGRILGHPDSKTIMSVLM